MDKKTNINRILKQCLVTLTFISILFFAKATALSDLTTAFQQNDANAIAKYFNNTVLLNIAEKQNNVSSFQAEMIIKEFLIKNKVSSFNVTFSKNNASDNSLYLVASMGTTQVNYKVSITVSNANAPNFKIDELTIEKGF